MFGNYWVLKFTGLERNRERDKKRVISFLKKNRMSVLNTSGNYMEVSVLHRPSEMEALMEMRNTHHFMVFITPHEKRLEVDTERADRIEKILCADLEKAHQDAVRQPWTTATLNIPVQEELFEK